MQGLCFTSFVSLSMSSGPPHHVAGVRMSFLLRLKNICLQGHTLSVRPSISGHWVVVILATMNTEHPCTKITRLSALSAGASPQE